MKGNKKLLVAVLGIIGVVLTVTGVTVAWFSYGRNGLKENTITSGRVKFHYQEGSTRINVSDMMPMTDAQGKAQTDAFDFTITADTSRTLDIPYYITVRRTADSFADLDSVVKVYLTKVNMVNNEEQESDVILSKFSNLTHYENSQINIPLTEKTIHNDTVLAGTTNYTQKYRLRIWVDTDANYLVQTPTAAYCERNSNHETVTEIDSQAATEANCTGEDYTWHPADVANTYPLNNKTYALTVNVYGEGNDIGEAEANYRSSTEIETLTVENNTLTTTDGVNYTDEITMMNETTTKTVTIETENPDATVTVENLTPQAMNVEKSKTRRLSTVEEISLPIKMGTNIFRITVTSANKLDTKVYNLTITGVAPPAPSNFATDSWESIIYAIKTNNTSAYNIGATRNITLSGFGTHPIRIANKSTPAACSNSGYSQSACGFVLEFADIITTRRANLSGCGYDTRYVDADMSNYLNTTVYNAMPSDLKKYIIDTNIVAFSLDKSQSNYIENQKIYPLSRREVFDAHAYSANYTHVLEYYGTNNTSSARTKKYGNNNMEWWSRDNTSDTSGTFFYIDANGNGRNNYCYNNYGVSPAFRIGYKEN